MRENDYSHFSKLLDQVCGLLGKDKYKPDAQATAIWFRTLAAYDLEAVRTGFDAHVRDPDRGRFVPVPADIIAKISAASGRPGPDEAWALAVKGAGEDATVTWNDDIAEAWGIALPVWRAGDEIGARMAFKDAYERITNERKGAPVRWWASLGHDPEQRTAEVRQGVAAGLLGHEAALMLQAPDNGTLARLANDKKMPAHARESLLALRDRLAGDTPSEAYIPNPDVARTFDLKALSREKYEAHLRELGFEPGQL